MGYRLLTEDEAARLPRRVGSLGMDVDRAQQVTDSGMAFDLMRVKQVRRGSPAAQAGFAPGDTIIAVDGRVFPTIAAFAAYVGSATPDSRIELDYIPAGGGPQRAQRVAVTVSDRGQATQAPTAGPGTRGDWHVDRCQARDRRRRGGDHRLLLDGLLLAPSCHGDADEALRAVSGVGRRGGVPFQLRAAAGERLGCHYRPAGAGPRAAGPAGAPAGRARARAAGWA